MKRKLTLLIALLLITLIAFTACSSDETLKQGANGKADSKETINVTFADYGSSSMPPADAYKFGVNYIYENSGGRINIEYVPDAVLGNETEMIQQLMDGTMQMGTLGTSTFSKFTDKFEVFQLPFLITDYEKEQIAFESVEGQALLDTAEELGLKIVGYTENGIRHFANNIKPINKPDGAIRRKSNSLKLRRGIYCSSK